MLKAPTGCVFSARTLPNLRLRLAQVPQPPAAPMAELMLVLAALDGGNVLPVLDPADLIGLGVSQMTCLTMLGAAYSAAKTKKLVTDDVLDNVAKHQLVLEEEQREHRAEVARLRIRELPSDLCCPIMVEIMKDPVICVGDGHTYERCAITQWFSTGSEISPMTNQPLETTQLVPNHMAKKLIHALLEEHPAGALKN